MKKIGMKIKKSAIVLITMLALNGCANLGPKQFMVYQYDYNNSLNYGLNQELLLNIVRLAYDDTPYFLTVSSISAQLELTTNGNALVSLAPNNSVFTGTTDTYEAQAGVSYTQRPTITYVPMSGQDFSRQMLGAVNLADVEIFAAWNASRAFRVMVQSMGDLHNAENAIHPTPEKAPRYFDQYLEFSRSFKNLQESAQVQLHPIKDGDTVRIEALFKDKRDPEVQHLFKLLGVPPDNNSIIFVQADQTGVRGNVVNVETRSFLGMLYYLSKSVEIPPADRKAGLASLTRNPDGSFFDWREVTGGMMVVHASRSVPKNAYIKVYYRNYWFYIADNDQNSKKTISMMSQLYALLEKDVGQTNPVLTLPV